MTIGCGEYLGQIFSTARASRSVLPPAENGTMTLIGLDGNLSCDSRRSGEGQRRDQGDDQADNHAFHSVSPFD